MKPGPFTLSLLDAGDGGRLFAIHFDGELDDELTALLHDPAYADAPDLDALDARLDDMVASLGFRDRYFTSIARYPSPFAALRYEKGPYRIYCCRYGRDLLVVGGGGHKPPGTGPLQSVPTLNRAFELVKYVSAEIDRRIRSKELHSVYDPYDGISFDPSQP